MSRSPGRPAGSQNSLSRDALLTLAAADFAEKGFAGVSIRKLAAEAGVSDSLFIHHFGSKQQLWYEAVDRMITQEFQQLYAQMQQAEQTDPLSLLRGHFAECLRLAQRRPALFRLLFTELGNGGERSDYLKTKYLVPYVKQFDHAIAQCQALGLLKPVARDSLHALLLGAVKILIRPEVLQQGLPDTHSNQSNIVVDDLLEMMFNGVVAATVK